MFDLCGRGGVNPYYRCDHRLRNRGESVQSFYAEEGKVPLTGDKEGKNFEAKLYRLIASSGANWKEAEQFGCCPLGKKGR